MKDDDVVVGAEDAVHVEVLYGGELRRDVVVLEVLGHFGEFALAPEAEEWLRLVDVQDAVAVDAEGGAAVFEHSSCAGQRCFVKSSHS